MIEVEQGQFDSSGNSVIVRSHSGSSHDEFAGHEKGF